MSTKPNFQIQATDKYMYWAESVDGVVNIHRSRVGSSDGNDLVLASWDIEMIRNLLIWADEGNNVTCSFTGPLAVQVRSCSKSLSLSPEMFIWHAVKLFMEVNSDT